jgi:hypothetical protein
MPKNVLIIVILLLLSGILSIWISSQKLEYIEAENKIYNFNLELQGKNYSRPDINELKWVYDFSKNNGTLFFSVNNLTMDRIGLYLPGSVNNRTFIFTTYPIQRNVTKFIK